MSSLASAESDSPLDQILSDYLLAEERGQAPTWRELLARYPTYADELRPFFETRDQLESVTQPLRVLGDPLSAGRIPRRFDRFELLSELGRGGMGIVYRALDTRLKRIVAIKILLSGPYASREEVDRFTRGARALAQLNDPGIVPVFEIGSLGDPPLPYLSMPVVDGPTLAAELQATGTLSPARAAGLLRQCALSVHYAHQQGVIHRDLKPANLMLTGQDRIQITDFGLARQVTDWESITGSGQLLGTPSYMAPEQIHSHESDGIAADVYGLGAVLFASLTGRPPFQASSVAQTLQMIAHQDPVSPRRLNPAVSADLETICLKALRKHPTDRYPSAQAMADDLDRLLNNQPIRARPVSAWVKTRKWVRRHRALSALATLSMLAAGSFLAGGVYHHLRLQQALTQTRQARLAERSERLRADQGYQHARVTLQQMLQTLDRQELQGIPRMGEIRKRMIEEASRFYEQALQQNPDSAQVQYDAARAFRLAGNIQFSLNDRESALDSYSKATRLLTQLTQAHPATPRYLQEYAGHATNMGLILGGTHEAREWAERAVRIATRHAELHHEYHPVAQATSNLGTHFQYAGRLSDARDAYRASLRWVGRSPAPLPKALLRSRAETQVNLANVLAALGSTQEAESLFISADETLQQLLTQAPGDLELMAAIAGNLVNWANLLAATERSAQALSKYGNAIQWADRILRLEPQHTDARAHLLAASGARGMHAWQQRSDPRAALPDLRRVVELSPAADRTTYQGLLVLAAAHAESWDETKQLCQELLSHSNAKPELLFNLASALSLLASNQAATQRERDQFAEQALHSLNEAADQGLFGSPAQRELLRAPDLDAIRDRVEFRNLVRKYLNEPS